MERQLQDKTPTYVISFPSGGRERPAVPVAVDGIPRGHHGPHRSELDVSRGPCNCGRWCGKFKHQSPWIWPSFGKLAGAWFMVAFTEMSEYLVHAHIIIYIYPYNIFTCVCTGYVCTFFFTIYIYIYRLLHNLSWFVTQSRWLQSRSGL